MGIFKLLSCEKKSNRFGFTGDKSLDWVWEMVHLFMI